MVPPPLRATLFPYTTLFRSRRGAADLPGGRSHDHDRHGAVGGVDDVPRHALSSDPGAHAVRAALTGVDRKSTRLNSSHLGISYAVFCLKKKIKDYTMQERAL